MKLHKYFVLAIIVLVIEIAGAVYIGSLLPADAKMPIHWNIQNQIDGWAGKNTAIFPFWLFNLGIFLLMMFSGKLFPVFRQNQDRYDAMIPLMTFGLVLFFALMHIYILLLGLHPDWAAKIQFIFILMGGLFIFLGNILPRIPRNFIAGYKLSWTLYNDEIWRRTHRLGGWCFVLVGLLMLVRGLFNINAGWMNVLMIVAFVVLIFGPILYSFLLYLKDKKEK